MTPESVETLKRRVVKLMSAYIENICGYSANELKRIHKRLTPCDITKEIADFFQSYTGEVLSLMKSERPEYLQRARKGDLEWFQNGGQIDSAFSCLFCCAHYGRHEIALFVIDNHREELQSDGVNLSDFLCLDLDGRMMSILCTLGSTVNTRWRNAGVAGLVERDNWESFQVLLSYYSPRMHKDEFQKNLMYYLNVSIENDSVGCFSVLLRYSPGLQDFVDVRCMIFQRKSYRISKYYGMEKTFHDRLFSALVG